MLKQTNKANHGARCGAMAQQSLGAPKTILDIFIAHGWLSEPEVKILRFEHRQVKVEIELEASSLLASFHSKVLNRPLNKENHQCLYPGMTLCATVLTSQTRYIFGHNRGMTLLEDNSPFLIGCESYIVGENACLVAVNNVHC